MARPRRRAAAAALWLAGLAAFCPRAAADDFLGKFEFPSQDSSSVLTFNTVDSVNVSWFTHDDSISNTFLVLASADPVPQPLVNMSVPSDGSQLVALNFGGQAINNATFTISSGGVPSNNSLISGAFNVVVNGTATPATYSQDSFSDGSSSDDDSDDHHHHDDSGDSNDSSDSSSTQSSALSPTIIALIVLLTVAFVFVVLLVLRFIHVRRRLAAQTFSRKDSETSSASSWTPARPSSSSWSSHPPAPPPAPAVPKQQRVLGMAVGAGPPVPRRMQSRRWFGHALRNSEGDGVAPRHGPAPVMPAAAPVEHSLALRPAGMPRDSSTGVSSPGAATLSATLTGDMPSEMPATSTASTFRGYELPAKQAAAARSTMGTEGRWSRFTEKTLPVLPEGRLGADGDGDGDGELDKGQLEADRIDSRLVPPPLNIPELEATSPTSPGRSPRKSPGIRATAISVLRGSAMTVPFALASPRNWKKSARLAPDEGVPF